MNTLNLINNKFDETSYTKKKQTERDIITKINRERNIWNLEKLLTEYVNDEDKWKEKQHLIRTLSGHYRTRALEARKDNNSNSFKIFRTL
jgi:hypothetical protein